MNLKTEYRIWSGQIELFTGRIRNLNENWPKNIDPLLQNDLDPYLATNAHKNSLLEYSQQSKNASVSNHYNSNK